MWLVPALLKTSVAPKFIVLSSMPIVYVSSLLGHSNLSMTSRYLNLNRRGLHLAMQKLEAHQAKAGLEPSEDADPAVAQALHNDDERSLAVVQDTPASQSTKTTVQ